MTLSIRFTSSVTLGSRALSCNFAKIIARAVWEFSWALSASSNPRDFFGGGALPDFVRALFGDLTDTRFEDRFLVPPGETTPGESTAAAIYFALILEDFRLAEDGDFPGVPWTSGEPTASAISFDLILDDFRFAEEGDFPGVSCTEGEPTAFAISFDLIFEDFLLADDGDFPGVSWTEGEPTTSATSFDLILDDLRFEEDGDFPGVLWTEGEPTASEISFDLILDDFRRADDGDFPGVLEPGLLTESRLLVLLLRLLGFGDLGASPLSSATFAFPIFLTLFRFLVTPPVLFFATFSS